MLEGWADIQDEERDEIFQLIRKHYKIAVKSEDSDKVTYAGADYRASSKDNLFKEFRRICIDILSESGRKNKTSILNSFLVAVGIFYLKFMKATQNISF